MLRLRQAATHNQSKAVWSFACSTLAGNSYSHLHAAASFTLATKEFHDISTPRSSKSVWAESPEAGLLLFTLDVWALLLGYIQVLNRDAVG